MSGIDVVGLLLGVGTLFTSCIDAFNYFRAARDFEHSFKVLLVKLDIEKTRLLVWGNGIGILQASGYHAILSEPEKLELFKRILECIEDLLSNSQGLRESYGLQTGQSTNLRESYGLQTEQSTKKLLDSSLDYLSTGSMGSFRDTARRFFIRNASKLKPPKISDGPGAALRAKWAITDKTKFENLITTLQGLIDSLYLLPELLEKLDETIKTDISFVVNPPQLELIRDALDHSYPAWSETASEALTASESGTVDRRKMAERLRDMEGLETGNHSQSSAIDVESLAIESLLNELRLSDPSFVLTRSCQKMHSQDPCNPLQIATQCYSSQQFGYQFPSSVVSTYEKNGTALWQLVLDKIIKLKDIVSEKVDGYESNIFDLLKKDYDRLDERQAHALDAVLPLVEITIYCSPCACLLQTALKICEYIKKKASRLLSISIRPDDRIPSSCCDLSGRMTALQCIKRDLDKEQARYTGSWGYSDSPLLEHTDRFWLERRSNHLEYEAPYDYKEPNSESSYTIILGEACYLSPILQKAPDRRIPKESEIWKMKLRSLIYGRSFQFSFIQTAIPTDTKLTTSTPAPTIISPTSAHHSQAEPNIDNVQITPSSGVKRSPSPFSESSLVSKRTKETESTSDSIIREDENDEDYFN